MLFIKHCWHSKTSKVTHFLQESAKFMLLRLLLWIVNVFEKDDVDTKTAFTYDDINT